MARYSPLASPSATRAVLEQHGLFTKKSLGQNFLINDAVIAKILQLAELNQKDYVLEVGPGIGTLTLALLQEVGGVVSVEQDSDLIPVLAQTCAEWKDRFALIQKDALDLQKEELEEVCATLSSREGSAPSKLPNKLVANLPYAVAATLVLDFFQRFSFLESATVMVQKEVADRMMARPGNKNYGAYTVKLSLYAEPVGRFTVGPNNFFPPPHVDSAVIRLNRRVPAALSQKIEELKNARFGKRADLDLTSALRWASCHMAEAAFCTRRKTLANSCKAYFSSRGEEGKRIIPHLPQIFEKLGLDGRCRGEQLCLEQFIDLGFAYLCCLDDPLA